MTFRHLECALKVAQAGSINTAAKELLVSQPYLSSMINSLEKELGYSLFIRSSQGIICTPQGQAFMKYAENILSDLGRIRSISGDADAPLKVATYYSRFITDLFLRFHNRTPDAPRDRYREMGNMEVIEAVARREYSLGIIYHAMSKSDKFRALAARSGLDFHPLLSRMGTYLIMSDSHPLAKADAVCIDDLRSSPVVFFDDESTILYMTDHFILPRSPQNFAVSDRGAFTDALLSGQYLSIINTPYPEEEKMFVLKEISGAPGDMADIEVGSAYLTHRDHKLTAREREFIRALQREDQISDI